MKQVVSVVLLVLGVHGAGDGAWNYAQPEEWYKVNAECGNNLQSPIDLQSNSAEVAPPAFLRLWIPRMEPVPLELSNTGNTLLLKMRERGITLTGSAFWSQYTLDQIHYHSPSEHTINGRRYPLERHMVFKPSDATELEQLGQKRYPLVVIGTLYAVDDSRPDPLISQFEAHGLGDKLDSTLSVTLHPGFDMLRDEFFMYPGSLTTPPCSEVVTWHVSARIHTATGSQINKMQKIIGLMSDVAEGGNPRPTASPPVPAEVGGKGNARPIQPTNDRTVKYRSFYSLD